MVGRPLQVNAKVSLASTWVVAMLKLAITQ